jgi:phosphatidylglycerophosphatase A
LIERVIDIVKVPPARWIERSWPGGWGVVGDDVAAGLYTCAILHVTIHFRPDVVGLTT